MVSATSGTLVTCDIPVKEFLIWLDEGQASKFIIVDLDETHLFIHTRAVQFVKDELNKLYEENQYSIMDAENQKK